MIPHSWSGLNLQTQCQVGIKDATCSLGYRGIFFYRGKIEEYTHLRATWLQTLYQWGTVSDGYYLWLVVRECKHHPRKAVLGFLTAVLLLPSLSATGSGWFFWHKNHALRYGLNSLEMSCLEVVVPFSWGNFCQRQGRDLFQQSIQDSRFLQTTFTTKLSLYLYTSAISTTTSPPSVLATDYSEKTKTLCLQITASTVISTHCLLVHNPWCVPTLPHQLTSTSTGTPAPVFLPCNHSTARFSALHSCQSGPAFCHVILPTYIYVWPLPVSGLTPASFRPLRLLCLSLLWSLTY